MKDDFFNEKIELFVAMLTRDVNAPFVSHQLGRDARIRQRLVAQMLPLMDCNSGGRGEE